MGVTYANFQSLGIELSLKDVLKSSVKGFTIFSMVSSNILGWMLSGPGVLLCIAHFHWLKCALPGKVITASPYPEVNT